MNKLLRFTFTIFRLAFVSNPLRLIEYLRLPIRNTFFWQAQLTLGICFSLAALSGQAQSYGPKGVTVTVGSLPIGVYVDGSGTLYVSDAGNHQVQKWAPGATSGITVAGGNGQGSAPNQLNSPQGLYVDGSGAVYVADFFNHRIQKWASGATSGTTVAGGNGPGSAANQLYSPRGVYADGSGAVYVADQDNSRIQKWAAGATSGTTVAGGNDPGSDANQLYLPSGIYVDESESVYVVDTYNHRIQKFSPNSNSSKAGTTVAGGNGPGSAANQLNIPQGVYVDGSGTLYVSDTGNHRIQKWALGATSGITVAGGNGSGSAPNQLYNPQGNFMDRTGSIYVADALNRRVQKFSICQPQGSASLKPASATLTCSASSLTLTADGGDSYAFSPGATPLSNPNLALVSSPGLYSVTVTAPTGCTGVATTDISLNSNFVATASASSSTPLVGRVFSLSASGGTAYQWSAPPGTFLSVPSTDPVVSAGVLSSGVQTFTVVVNKSPLCSQTLTVGVTATTPPDLTLSLFARPSILYGSSAMRVVVNVVEINGQATATPIKLKLTKDAKVSLTFPTSATSVGGQPVHNSQWSFDPTAPDYYTLTSLAPIPAGGVVSVGLEGLLSPGATTGSLSISATISSGDAGGGNSTDADRIEYFPQ